jgi:23S rRNA (cytidine1920-2'-O)/16S rRNA (cytidine1409-2'-O)-methyltransferase
MPRVRADVLMLQRGLAETRERAQRLIMAGKVRTGTSVLVKPATMLEPSAPLQLEAGERFVSRGGEKLQAALDAWRIDLTGRRCLDVGASTGGFSDCMLQAGAASVLAVDVGRAQLHDRLRRDPRVTLWEQTNARDLPGLPPSISFFAVDVSFISLRTVLPSVASRLAPRTEGVLLLKPQFEAGRASVPRGGVIRDEVLRRGVLSGFCEWASAAGWTVLASMDCPLPGGDGNVEFLLHVGTPEQR